jgi:hypothetical protein
VAYANSLYRDESDNWAIYGEDLETLTVPETVWDGLLKSKEVEVNEGDKLTLTADPLWQDLEFNRDGFYDNCDVFTRGEISKTILETGLGYRANYFGAGCDNYALANVFADSEYLLQINAQNYHGRGLKTYVFRGSYKPNMLEVLLDEGKIQNFYALAGNKAAGSENYLSLSIGNNSFGQLAENDLYAVRLAQLPLAALANIKIETEGRGEASELVDLSQEENYLSKKQIGNWYYKFTLKESDKWQALMLPSANSKFWIVNKGVKQSFNGWALMSLVEPQTRELTAVFWPAGLSISGAILGGLTGIVLIIFHALESVVKPENELTGQD